MHHLQNGELPNLDCTTLGWCLGFGRASTRYPGEVLEAIYTRKSFLPVFPRNEGLGSAMDAGQGVFLTVHTGAGLACCSHCQTINKC